MSEQPAETACPSCGATMKPGAVLCIVCGYHTQLGGQLATVLDESESAPIDPNPYAAPSGRAETQATRRPGRGPVNDLTERGVKQTEVVVRDAETVGKVLLITFCCCSIAWPFIFPWYGFRLYQWYSLNAEFEELRFPNSLSNHGSLATRFQDARLRLWAGTLIGAICGSLFVLAVLSRALRLYD